MNVQPQQAPNPTQVARDLKADIREALHETLSVGVWHAGMVLQYLERGDDNGTIYQARQMMECIRTFLKSHGELVTMNERGREQ